jgi:predicted transcriptional regulator
VSGRDGRRAPGSLESEVMAVLWAAEDPLGAAGVQAELTSDLAYTTVQTILMRLYDKGLVASEVERRPHRRCGAGAAEQRYVEEFLGRAQG